MKKCIDKVANSDNSTYQFGDFGTVVQNFGLLQRNSSLKKMFRDRPLDLVGILKLELD
jgi:hypothetical protein